MRFPSFKLISRVLPFALVALMAGERAASAQPTGLPKQIEHVGVTEHLDGAPLPLDAEFTDHTGKHVHLGDFFQKGHPVLLTFAYHSCPMLCSMVLNATTEGLKGVNWTAGKEFDVVTISIDPNESQEKTNAKRTSILNQYGRPEAATGWHFLSGTEKEIARVASAAGFEYQYDPEQKQWGHSSVVMLVKPNGQMARYLYGLEFDPKDLKLGLLEASAGRSISTIEQLILYCYHYDPQGGKYVLLATRVMQVGGGLTALALGAFLSVFWLRERKRGRNEASGSHAHSASLVASVSADPASAR